MTYPHSTPKPKKSPVAGYIVLFALALEVVALIFGGFVVALFGLVAFCLGVAYITMAMIYDPDMGIASLNKIKQMDKNDDGGSL